MKGETRRMTTRREEIRDKHDKLSAGLHPKTHLAQGGVSLFRLASGLRDALEAPSSSSMEATVHRRASPASVTLVFSSSACCFSRSSEARADESCFLSTSIEDRDDCKSCFSASNTRFCSSVWFFSSVNEERDCCRLHFSFSTEERLDWSSSFSSASIPLSRFSLSFSSSTDARARCRSSFSRSTEIRVDCSFSFSSASLPFSSSICSFSTARDESDCSVASLRSASLSNVSLASS
ncbi:hypothetical protein EYF80_028995 [Liparis tanakae]|uniref:Uncharacterized protein n=1 Tax=Liparis tanakae TaxID=230148 RepID=A0A4Z2H6F3_9TELE|nr:hypothetical protein EYF80_028995 [Liparis tanakae]